MRTVNPKDEGDLLHDLQGHVLCERCYSIMEPRSPVEGLTWWECPACGMVEATAKREVVTDIIDRARAYLLSQDDACSNERCVGYEARDIIVELAAEVERLTEDIDTLHRECARLYEIEDEHRKCPL